MVSPTIWVCASGSAEHIAQKAVELVGIAWMKKLEDRFERMHSMSN